MAGIKTYTYEIRGWAGLNYLPNIADKAPNDIEDCRNVDFDEEGMIVKRRGCTHVVTFSGTVHMIHNFSAAVGFEGLGDTQRTLVVSGSTLHVIKDFHNTNVLSATFSATDITHYACSTNNGICYISNFDGGIPKMLSYVNGTWVYQSAAFDAPTVAPTVAGTGSGALVGSYGALYSYGDQYGNESNPSPSVTATLSSQEIAVGVTASSDPTANEINIYVLAPNSTEYHFVGTTSNTSGTFTSSGVTDTTIDAGDLIVRTNYPCPSGRYVCIYNDMLIVGGNLTVPDQVFCSNWAYHRQFNIDEDFDRVTSNDGQPVRGFGYLYADLIIGKADSLHNASGADNTVFHAKQYNPSYGVIGQNSILSFDKKLAFFSDIGIFVDAGLVPIEISRKLRHLIRNQNPIWMFRQPTRQVSCHYTYYKKLYFAIRLETATDGPMDSLLVYNYEMDSWTIHNGFNITALGMSELGSGDDYDFMYGGDENGNVFYFAPPNASYNDDTIGGVTSSINSYAETPWIHLPKAKGLDFWEGAKTEAAWLALYAGGEPASGNSTISITTTLYTDFDMTVRATYCTTHKAENFLTYAQKGLCPCQPKRIKSFGGNLGTFEWIKLRFANNSPGEHFKIQKLVFGFRARPGVEE